MERNIFNNFTRTKLREDLRLLETLSPARAKLNKLWILNTKDKKKINDNLWKLMTDHDMIWNAYQKIKKNKGSMTPGTREETADGFNQAVVERIGNMIRNGYKWSSIKRKEIPKPGKKEKRQLGLPNFYDKIVQENIRLILNTIYEPIFQENDSNHGFRPNRSTSTAVERVKNSSQGMTTAIEGDFKKAYDNIRKKILIEILKKKISDNKFLKIIETSFEVDIVDEKGKISNNSGIGVPQGSLASPILFNIVLHEFDNQVSEITERILKKKNEEEGRLIKTTSKNYEAIRIKINNLKRSMKKNKDENDIKKYKNFEKHKIQKKELRKMLTKKRSIEPMAKVKQLLFYSYTRYADDWIILTNADVQTCKKIKEEIAKWTMNEIGLELNQEKTLITNFEKEQAKFLGFTFFKAEDKIRSYLRLGQKVRSRLNIGLSVGIDQQRVLNRLREKKIINTDNKPVHNSKLLMLEPWQIVEAYTQKIRGLINYYYHNIVNKSALSYYYYLIKYSCLKTLANKKKIFHKRYNYNLWIQYKD